MPVNEVIPRKSRSLVMQALGQFRDLQDSGLPEEVRLDMVWRLGLPLAVRKKILSSRNSLGGGLTH